MPTANFRDNLLAVFEAVVFVDSEVHLGGVVGPSSELQVTGLLVERIKPNVDGAHGPKHAAWLPANSAASVQHRLELIILAVDAFRANNNDNN